MPAMSSAAATAAKPIATAALPATATAAKPATATSTPLISAASTPVASTAGGLSGANLQTVAGLMMGMMNMFQMMFTMMMSMYGGGGSQFPSTGGMPMSSMQPSSLGMMPLSNSSASPFMAQAQPLSSALGTSSLGSLGLGSSGLGTSSLLAPLSMPTPIPAPIAALPVAAPVPAPVAAAPVAKIQLTSTQQLHQEVLDFNAKTPNNPQALIQYLNSRFSNSTFTLQPDGGVLYPISGKNFKIPANGSTAPVQVA